MQWLLDHIVCYFQTAIHYAVNAIVVAVGATIGVIVNLLPDMPGYPSIPSYAQTAMKFAYYLMDFGWLLGYIATFFALMTGVFAVSIALRWMRVIE